MSEDFYRGYLLVRLAKIGTEWSISNKMMEMVDPDGNWEVTFACPIYGAWDLMIEISFKQLEDLDSEAEETLINLPIVITKLARMVLPSCWMIQWVT